MPFSPNHGLKTYIFRFSYLTVRLDTSWKKWWTWTINKNNNNQTQTEEGCIKQWKRKSPLLVTTINGTKGYNQGTCLLSLKANVRLPSILERHRLPQKSGMLSERNLFENKTRLTFNTCLLENTFKTNHTRTRFWK